MWPFSPFHSLFIAGDLLPLLPPFERTSLFSAKHSPDTHRGTDADAQAGKGESSLGSGPPLTKKPNKIQVSYEAVPAKFGFTPLLRKTTRNELHGKNEGGKNNECAISRFFPVSLATAAALLFFCGNGGGERRYLPAITSLGTEEGFLGWKEMLPLVGRKVFFLFALGSCGF